MSTESPPIELFWGSGSAPAWRAMLGFAFKGAPYTSRRLSFSDRETRTEWYRAIHPRGKVPCVREGTTVVPESLAILAWLDRRFPHGPALFGTEPARVGAVWAACLDYENYAEPAFSAVVRPLLFGVEPEVGSLELAGGMVAEELERFEGRVKASAAVVGDALSAADIVWYCGLRRLDRALSRPRARAHALGLWPLLERSPGLTAWARRVEAIPGFAATVPPHWLESTPPTPEALT